MVGCVIVYDNTIVAEGYHQNYGGPHAEVNAYSNLCEDIPLNECEIYVSLEPCTVYGKTPPCANLIVEKKPKIVYVGMLDPNPKVAGSGIKLIREAGIEVKVGYLKKECGSLIRKFSYYHLKKRPFITLKWAETADGYIGRLDSQKLKPKQISSKKNKALVHKLRANHQAILIGANTALLDDPKLNLRYWMGNNPVKIILSKDQYLKPSLKVFKAGRTLLFANTNEYECSDNVEVVVLDNFDLSTILSKLYELKIQSILIEGGLHVLQAFIDANFWNEAIVFKSNLKWQNGVLAPKMSNKYLNKVHNQNNDNIYTYQRE